MAPGFTVWSDEKPAYKTVTVPGLMWYSTGANVYAKNRQIKFTVLAGVCEWKITKLF